jgi:hypothetical protein
LDPIFDMMFLLRSAFWLSVAFVVIRPDVDVAQTATALSGEAVTRGGQFVATQVEAIECDNLTCLGGKAVVSAALQPVSRPNPPMHILPGPESIPLPRPRPDHSG